MNAKNPFPWAVAAVSIACASGQHPAESSARAGEPVSTDKPSSEGKDSRTGGELQGRVEVLERYSTNIAGSEQIGRGFDRFKMDSSTQVTVNGEKASLADLNEGDDVRASYSVRNDGLHLDRIDVVAKPTAPAR